MSLVEVDRIYTNRELSWLEFNQRVLDQAASPQTPLLERLKFLGITGSNLDEFFMVRVGGLSLQAEGNPDKAGIAGVLPYQQLQQIRHRVLQMYTDQYRIYSEQIEPGLADQGLVRLEGEQLSAQQLSHTRQVFEEEILPVLSPIAVTGADDFPLMTGSPLGLCFKLRGDCLGRSSSNAETDTPRFVVLSLRRGLPRIMSVPSADGFHFVLLEHVVERFAEAFFPGQIVDECVPFRATRNADLNIDEDAADLLLDMREMLDARKTSDCVRLELGHLCSQTTRDFLQQALNVSDEHVYSVSGPIDLSALTSLATTPGFNELKYEPWPPQPSPDFKPGDDVFEVIAAGDRLLVHPYQSYDPVVKLIEAAAQDPQVIAIKQTLYRVSRNSQIVAALQQAAENGKNVTVIIELKARFDESRNISWAQRLEKSGGEVIYGVRGLKTHAKLCIIVRRESFGIRRYLHFGTGNYNESTARLYSDISFLTCDQQLGSDAVHLFNAITGLSIPQPMNHLVAAPSDLRTRLLELIEVETANAKRGREAAIDVKVNALVDKEIIDALYDASQAGVRIRLNVRGICCLRPGVDGLSENIQVVSVVDRYLEHARILHFLHGGDHRVFISSADWMGRSFDRRVELLVPIEDHQCKSRLMEILDLSFRDEVNAWRFKPDGAVEPPDSSRAAGVRSQQVLYQLACQEHQAQALTAKTVFEPHRANPVDPGAANEPGRTTTARSPREG